MSRKAIKTQRRKPSMDDEVTIICYRQEEKMTRREAMKEYFEGMMCCDGSEKERYATIYEQLVMGAMVCSDEL